MARRSEVKRALGLLVAGLVACGPSSPSRPGATASPSTRPSPVPSVTTPIPAPEPSFAPVGRFSARRAMRHVRVLAGRIGPRAGGSGAYHRAVRYVARALRGEGWTVEVDAFALPQGGRSTNVIATSGSDGGPTLVVGAHLDTVEGSPGGNDNASGVAVLLEVARALSGTRFAGDLVLVAFGAEERQPDGSHHVGSERYVRQVVAGRRPAAGAMASVDMIGKDAPLVVGWLGTGPRTMVGTAVRSARRAGVVARAEVLGDVSDHVPFARIGVPAALLWTGLEPNYHSPSDRVTNVDAVALRNVGEVVLGIVRRLSRG